MFQMISKQISENGAKSAEAFKGAAQTHQKNMQAGKANAKQNTTDINKTEAGDVTAQNPIEGEDAKNTAEGLDTNVDQEAPEVELVPDNPFFNNRKPSAPTNDDSTMEG